MSTARFLPAFLLAALLLTSCSLFRSTADPSETRTSAPQKSEDEDPFEPWDETLEDTQEIEGFLTLHRTEDRTLYAEVPPEQLGETFGLVMHISHGVGTLNLHDGLPLSGTRLMQFRRVGNKIHLVQRNPRFRADKGAMRRSLEENRVHSPIRAFDIVSENDSTKHLLIKLSDFLVSDYAQIGERAKFYFDNQPPRLQDDRSYISDVKGFPENVEIDARLTYEASDPPVVGGEALPDYRAIPVGVRYSIFQLPEQPMQARFADDRVGYFINTIKDLSQDQQRDPYIRYIQRWRLTPSDTAAYKQGELVEPEEPIVYYIDRTVPERYRPYVREGIEAWDEAFRAAGYKNAIVAKLAPDDSSWSAEDIRYSTVRWTAAHQMGYAIGPSQTDPRTGEILNADVLISSSFVRGWQETFNNLTPDAQSGAATERLLPLEGTPEALRRMFPSRLARRACWAERGMAQQIGLQRAVLAARGALAPDGTMPEEYLGGAIKDLVMHEVGHTLGLRHNFKASSGIPSGKLQNEEYTREHGVSLSVMDYAPVNLALQADEQGYYWNPAVGTYDEWAIQYGYMPITRQSEDGPLTREGPLADTTTAAEPGLNKIAAESSDPLHTYGTDEDNWLGAYAVDPLTNAWELGSRPMAFAETRTRLVRKVKPKLDDRLVQKGEAYHSLREATTALMFERYRALQPVAKMVGGMYVARDHKGTPDARMPFRPVPADTQRAAVELMVEEAFAPDAFQFDAERLNKLAPNHHADWGTARDLRLDYPVHDMVGAIQSSLLISLLHPARLQRMIDNQVRMKDTYTPGELIAQVTDAVWAELDAKGGAPSINSFRRNLQRTYTDHLIDLMLDTTTWLTITIRGGDQVAAPEDVRSLARLELRELSSRIDQVLARRALDRTTEAHLSETKVRIDRALDASFTLQP